MIDKSGINQYLERLTQIYFGLISLPLLLFPVVYLPMKDSPLNSFSSTSIWENTLYCTIFLLLVLVIFFARRLFKRSLGVISDEWILAQKLKGYRRTSIIFYLFCLVASIIAVILLLITEHQLFVACYPVLLLLVSFYRPTIQRLERELPLNKEELTMIKHKRKKADDVG